MYTPEVQRIADAVREEFDVTMGAYKCRHIAGTMTWSQHAWTEDTGSEVYLGNAVDIFGSVQTLDQVYYFVNTRFPLETKSVLWRIKNHFDHVHVDTWPTGYGLPPCRGGSLRVKHRDGRIGRTFQGDQDVPLSADDLAKIQALPLSADNIERIVDAVWFRLITNPVSGLQRGAQGMLADAVKYSHQAANS